jgi:hypothetical protein
VTRYRLNRGGDRQLNRALHTILLVRLRADPDTRAYLARRTAEGKRRRDAKRRLRRVIARQLLRLLERYDQPGVEILRAARRHIAPGLDDAGWRSSLIHATCLAED